MSLRSPRTKATAPATAYHHGALREALLVAAEALLSEQGVEGFTLRECARRAGVSHAAPAHHFGDVRGLLTAVATDGFVRLAALMHKRREAADDDPRAKLVALGQAYIDFALRHPALFQLMFSQGRLDPDDAPLQAAWQQTIHMLSAALLDVTQARGLSLEELPVRMLLAWSAVHGFATLANEGLPMLAFGLAAGGTKGASAAAAQMLTLLAPALENPLRDAAGTKSGDKRRR